MTTILETLKTVGSCLEVIKKVQKSPQTTTVLDVKMDLFKERDRLPTCNWIDGLLNHENSSIEGSPSRSSQFSPADLLSLRHGAWTSRRMVT